VYKNGKPRPGDIFIKDIYQMKLSADLVVLSSCQSALGKQQAGEGPISLSRAFLFAGAKAVVASLWEVNSEATGELMQRFYHYRQNQKMPPSTALAMAQADFRNHPDKRFRNPFYWAGFEFYGEWMVQ
jgi:CHAT domain-containing protein